MNILERFNKTKFLLSKEINWLANDILGEFGFDNPKDCPDRRLVAWFLRNKLYIPYRKISHVLNYHRAPVAYHADMSYATSTDMVFSMSGYEKDKIDIMRQIADEHYGCEHNLYLDRCYSSYLEEALLMTAADVCGMRDKQSNFNAEHALKKTPSESQLVNFSKMLRLKEMGYSPEEILDNYEIIKNE